MPLLAYRASASVRARSRLQAQTRVLFSPENFRGGGSKSDKFNQPKVCLEHSSRHLALPPSARRSSS